MPRVFVLLLALTFCPAALRPMGGSVPSGYPSTFMMGHVFEAHVDAAGRYVAAGSEFNTIDHYMAPIGTGWGATYKYIIGGPRAAGGANSWWNAYPGGGGMPTNFMNLANGRNYQPMFIYMNLQALSGNSPSGVYAAFQSQAFMGQYFSDWADLMTRVDSWLTANPGKVVTIDLEPDAWGYMQQNYSNDPAAIPARVATATNPGGAYPWVSLTAFPNTVQGVTRALLHIKDVRLAAANRTRLKLALHVSSWAVAPNPATSQSAVNVATHAATVSGFLNACKTTATAGASDWDLWFLDPADGDAALYQVNGLDTAGSTHWWDANNVNQPTFNRYRDWVNALSNGTSKRCMLWQMPIGNQVYRTLNNTHGHYQDNRAEYFLNPTNGLAHVCDWASNGVIGILWGRGSIIPVGGGYTVGTGGQDYYHISWATDYSGGTQDNITNAGATGINATVADDDGGYLRSRMPAYFAAPCTLPGVGTATPSPSASPNFTRTITPTVTLTPICPGGAFDNLEDNNGTNQWGGTWSAYNPGGGTTMAPAAFAPSAAGAAGGSAYGARINGSVTGTNYPSVSSFLNAATTQQNVCTYNGIRFDFKGTSGSTYRFQVHSSQQDTPTMEYNDFFFNVTANGAWQAVTVPYSALIHPGYGRAYTLNCANWRYLSWLPLNGGVYDMNIDNVEFVCLLNTPTPSITATSTRTATRSATPSATASITAQPSFTQSPTRTASPTPSSSASPSLTRTNSPVLPSATATLTRTPTASPSLTGSLTATASPTASRTSTVIVPSATTTNTALPGSTFTSTATASPTRSVSPSHTSSPVPTSTPSRSATATGTRTVTVVLPSSTPSNTPLPGSTFTSTSTVSPTRSATASITPSVSMTSTASASRTAMPSSTVTLTDQPTSTPPPGSTATFTRTISATASPSPTAIVPSATPSNTNVAAATRTATPSNTALIVASRTSTLTASPTSSHTPVNSATQTPGANTSTPISNGSGPNEVIDAVPVPQPNPSSLAVKVAGPCDGVQVRVYSRAMNLISQVDGPGSAGPGWVAVPLPQEWRELPSGQYYFTARSMRAGEGSLKVKKGSLVVLK